MDKQFARILMLSILLPAGAALAEAIQHEHVSFAGQEDQGLMSTMATLPPASAVGATAPASEKRATTSLKDHHTAGDVADNSAGDVDGAR